jgi:hypothetical protein
MSKPIEIGRACGLCGEQITLSVKSDDRSYYTDDLTTLLEATSTAKVVIKAECDCSPPRTVTLEGTSWRPNK